MRGAIQDSRHVAFNFIISKFGFIRVDIIFIYHYVRGPNSHRHFRTELKVF